MELLLFLYALVFFLYFLQFSLKCCSVELGGLSLDFNLLLQVILFRLVPVALLDQHLLVNLSPLPAELEELVDL